MPTYLRSFREQRGFAAAVVLVLGLCLGANSALFTVVNSLLLRPLPFPQSERLVDIAAAEGGVPLADLKAVRSMESAGAMRSVNFGVASPDGVHMAFGFRVSRDLLPLLRIQPAMGRALTSADFGSHVAMITHEYWRTLGGTPGVIGQPLTLDGELYTIAGVLPADFYLGVRDAKLIVPNLDTEGRLIGRLRPGATPAQARDEIAALRPGINPEVTPLARAFQSNDGRPVVLLLATAAFVLLITCVNLANLQLVRGFARRREFAIRTALGATARRILMELAAEAALLAAAGAGVGLLLTHALHDFILSILPANISRRLSGADALAMDTPVIAFTIGAALITMVLFGLLPALSSLRFDVVASLRQTGLGANRIKQRVGQTLVAVEIALALMLLAGAGLTFKSLAQVESQYLGFQPQGVLRAMINFPPSRYTLPDQQSRLFAEVERRVAEISGVARVGIVAPQAFPFGGPAVRGARFEIFGKPEIEARAEVYAANPAYLEAIRLPLLRGRWFTAADNASAPPVAVLSEAVAHRYWGGQECIGQRVRLNSSSDESVWATVIGVAGDVKNPLAEQWQPTAYRPFAQTPSSGAVLMIRAGGGDPRALAPALREELHAIDPTAPDAQIVAALDSAVRDYSSQQRFTTALLAVFAAIGLALAVAGVYGVMRYWVVSRTGEIGVRLAIGAQRSSVLRLVIARAATAAGIGVAGGLAGEIALRKVIAAQLVGVSPLDPVVLGGVTSFLFAVAILAAWMPARWAARVNPAVVLRGE